MNKSAADRKADATGDDAVPTRRKARLKALIGVPRDTRVHVAGKHHDAADGTGRIEAIALRNKPAEPPDDRLHLRSACLHERVGTVGEVANAFILAHAGLRAVGVEIRHDDREFVNRAAEALAVLLGERRHLCCRNAEKNCETQRQPANEHALIRKPPSARGNRTGAASFRRGFGRYHDGHPSFYGSYISRRTVAKQHRLGYSAVPRWCRHEVHAMRLFPALLALLFLSGHAAAQKAYSNDQLASDAIRLEEQVKRDVATAQTRPVEDLRRDAQAALARNDAAGAAKLLAAVAAATPREAAGWRAYAQALLASGTSYQIQQTATAAAYLAYQRAAASADQAAALALLADIFAKRNLWRPALDAWHTSLDLADVPTVRAIYMDARAKHGFRILDYKVDSDSAAPRVCFQFSEDLAHGKVDFAPYVTLAGAADAALSTEDRQLCVEGLKHGERYAIVVRQGLPSAVGETLLKSEDYQVYVRDRAAQVHFTGRNYVLPRVGQEGIPVVSVNSRTIGIDIVRVGDRNLLPTVRSEDFLQQLSGYRIKQFVENDGAKVWSGTLAVESVLNKDVTTAFPVTEAVGTLKPGVYVMLARPGDDGPAAKDSDDTGGGQSATQWFIVSDLGLTALSGRDGLHVFAHSLASAAPRDGIAVRLVARNNEVLATQRTGADGHVRFDPGLSRGTGGLAPGLVVAEDSGGDYGFLDLGQTPFDLTDRGVKGRTAPGALDAFVVTERGVYRSGETVFITALLRDAKGVAVPDLPLTLVVKRPDGVEYKRVQVADAGDGGRGVALPLLDGVATGGWRIDAYADPKSDAVGHARFLVEDYVPERLDFAVKPAAPAARSGETVTIAATARYLYGAPGADLDVSGEVAVGPVGAHGLPALEGYVAGLQDETFETVRADIDPVTTDEEGVAAVAVAIPEVQATQPLEAKITLRAAAEGGRAVERIVTVPLLPSGGLIGVKKTFTSLTEGAQASFDVIAVDSNGIRDARKGVRWSLYKVSNDYQWFRQDGRWSFERVKSTKRVAEGIVEIPLVAPGRIAALVGLGAYRLDIAGADGTDAPTSVSFEAGWSGDASAATPDRLDMTLDKASYVAGDQMRINIMSRFAGKATIAIASERVETIQTIDLKAGDNVATIPVSADWGGGAYAVVLAHRPLDVAAKRAPGRALGLAWFSVDTAAHKIDVALGAPQKVRPRGPVAVPITLTGLAPGETAHVTLAAVDVGILNLTHYETPDPLAYFYGQRQLGTDIWDLYGYLIDGMQGVRGAIRSGGDSGGALEGNKPTQAPVALYSGVVAVGADGKATVSFDLPDFNGTLRLAALAWTKTKVGSVSTDVIVRDAVVAQATLPRFVALGDRSRLHVALNNVEGRAGDYKLDFTIAGPLSAAPAALHQTVRLAANGRAAVTVPVEAAGVGTATIAMRLSGPGLDAPQSFAVRVEPGTSDLYRRTVRTLAPGTSLTVSPDLVADFVPGTGAVSVAAAALAGIDVADLLLRLDRYPYGCSEQLVSRALPLLYVNRIARAQGLGIDTDVDQRVQDTIAKVLARQDSNGTFGLWSAADEDDLWLHAFVTDFLTRARESNFSVPQRAFDQALERLRNVVANATDIKREESAAVAYAAYVLARNGRPVIGDLRYLADTQIEAFDSPLARAQLAAALAQLGDRARARTVFGQARDRLDIVRDANGSRADYGSRLRDGAALLALAVETGAPQPLIDHVADVVSAARDATPLSTTQENLWMVLAAEAASTASETAALSVDGVAQRGAYSHVWRGGALNAAHAVIANQGPTPARVVVTTSGAPRTPEPAAAQGYALERAFFALDGTPLDPTQIKQNDRFAVTLKVTEPAAAYAKLLLVDRLPAGLEIENPDLYAGGSIEELKWLQGQIKPTHTEYRDDRFVAAFDRNGADAAVFGAAYIVRAVTPGHYALPPATIEDMYRPQRYGRTAYGTLDIAAPK